MSALFVLSPLQRVLRIHIKNETPPALIFYMADPVQLISVCKAYDLRLNHVPPKSHGTARQNTQSSKLVITIYTTKY